MQTAAASTGADRPALEVRSARKRFAERAALDGVDLCVAPGEWVALLGPNGAGKTTLVKAVAGRVRLDDGAVALFGATVAPLPNGDRSQLGVVPQEVALHPAFSARENLEHWGALAGVSRDVLGRRIDEALEWTGLADRADDRVDAFSGGMKRRLNIACSLLHEPRLVLLDEPTVGVDPQSRARIWEMLGELRARGTAVVLTTHQLDEAQDVSGSIAILDHGRIIARGSLDRIVDETLGAARRVELALRGVTDVAALGLEPGPSNGEVVRASTRLERLTDELPALFERVRSAGGEVVDVEVRPPSLQDVFIHLTGRELRDR
ncbi:Daunorubicin/doxorubicin resistance ATP-binding protein DrrA [Planctomycetes bacterium Pla163]|uniref:Daunorubicin/doxorubicin resistance ATP-binding protein DrrA n=1 Tax=Rohdeia mirabilis TaxID=2528008 RepID=A0A518D4W2_9BACT|nr:Daunorubicin/doxorubicin resistance ATP-binding protein DrrA [Planctomycetes bacterium Pla163]